MNGSVLETFIISFMSDASDLKKGAADAKKTTDDLNQKLKSTDAIGNKVGSTLGNLARQYGGLVLSILSVNSLIHGINNAANFADKLDELSKGLDVSVEDLSLWGDAVKLSGGTAESFQESIKRMTASLADFATKGTSRAAPFFKSLGIQMTDTQGKARKVFDILPELADKFAQLGKAESFGIGQKIGLDQGTIMLLQRGRREVEAVIARQKELGFVTKEDAEIAAAFNDQWDDVTHAFRSVFNVVGSTVLPAFTKVLKIIENIATFLRKNSTFVTGILIALGTAILVFVVPPLVSAAIAALALYAPFLLIGAAVAAVGLAFALLYDDIMNFLQGNDSVTGRILERWPFILKIFQWLKETFDKLWNQHGMKKFFEFMWEGLKGVWNLIEMIAGAIGSVITGVLDGIQMAVNAYEKVKSFFGGDEKTNESVAAAQTALIATNTPLSSQTSTSIQSSNARTSSNNVSIGPVAINTQATDAKGISEAIGPHFKTQMRNAVNAFDDGVAA